MPVLTCVGHSCSRSARFFKGLVFANGSESDRLFPSNLGEATKHSYASQDDHSRQACLLHPSHLLHRFVIAHDAYKQPAGLHQIMSAIDEYALSPSLRILLSSSLSPENTHTTMTSPLLFVQQIPLLSSCLLILHIVGQGI